MTSLEKEEVHTQRKSKLHPRGIAQVLRKINNNA